MKKISLVIVTALLSAMTFAQVKSPVHWSFSAKKVDATTYEISLTAIMEDDWHIYSQTTPDGGPVATKINFTRNPLLTIDGKTKEVGKLEQHYEELFGMEVKQYAGKVVFVQMVKRKAAVKTAINGTIAFMTCNDRECMPPATQKFTIALN